MIKVPVSSTYFLWVRIVGDGVISRVYVLPLCNPGGKEADSKQVNGDNEWMFLKL